MRNPFTWPPAVPSKPPAPTTASGAVTTASNTGLTGQPWFVGTTGINPIYNPSTAQIYPLGGATPTPWQTTTAAPKPANPPEVDTLLELIGNMQSHIYTAQSELSSMRYRTAQIVALADFVRREHPEVIEQFELVEKTKKRIEALNVPLDAGAVSST